MGGEVLLDQLSHVYNAYRLDEVRPRETDDEDGEAATPRIVCSEAMVEQKGRQEAKHRNKHNVTQEAVLVGEGPLR